MWQTTIRPRQLSFFYISFLLTFLYFDLLSETAVAYHGDHDRISAKNLHMPSDAKRCENCRQVFKTWKELHEHEKYCPRRFGVCDRKPDRSMRAPKPVKTPYKFQLCKRRYQTKEHLLNHQINRCAARYVTNAWVVKI